MLSGVTPTRNAHLPILSVEHYVPLISSTLWRENCGPLDSGQSPFARYSQTLRSRLPLENDYRPLPPQGGNRIFLGRMGRIHKVEHPQLRRKACPFLSPRLTRATPHTLILSTQELPDLLY